MARRAAAALAVAAALTFTAVAAGLTPLTGHYKGHDTRGTTAVSFNFDGRQVRDLHVGGHPATEWNAPKYTTDAFSAGNSDGGFFTGWWNTDTHVSGRYRPLSHANTISYNVHRVPQPKPGRYHGLSHDGSPVSFTLTGNHVTNFNYTHIVKVSATLDGPKFLFIGVHNSRNTTIESTWSSDTQLHGFIQQTGHHRVVFQASLVGR